MEEHAPIKVRQRHGLSRTPLYKLWHQMIQRCEKPAVGAWKYYGGRGIKVCSRWHDFLAFRADMGEKPSPEHSLDRVDNDGDYEPSNVRWATPLEQMAHTRLNRHLTINGETKHLSEWARIVGIAPHKIVTRLNKLGWSEPDAVLTPIGHRKGGPAAGLLITFDNRTLSALQWAHITGLSDSVIRQRFRKLGWSAKDTLTVPAGYSRPADPSRIVRQRGPKRRYLVLDGEKHTLAEWARRTGIGSSTIRMRIDKRGWSVEAALTVPVGEPEVKP